MARALGRGVVIASLCLTSSAVLYEDFPLSGGVADGVEVSVEVAGMDDAAKLEFLTPTRETAFGFYVDKASKMITRTSPLQPIQTWGGWPFDDTMTFPVNFSFTKRKFVWAVAVNGKRTPWFDHPIAESSAALSTHLRAYSAFKGVEVVQKRPVCAQECHPDECLDASGGSTCSDGPCFSTMPATNGVSGKCTNTSTMPDMGMHCCDGLPNQIPFESSSIGQWAEVLPDSAALQSACEAYEAEDVAVCASLSGFQVKIHSVNTSTHQFGVFVPELLDSLGEKKYMIGAEVLAARAPKRKIYTTDRTALNGITIDAVHGFISSVRTDVANEYGVPKNWFINMMTVDSSQIWFAFSIDRFVKAALSESASKDVNFLMVNQEVEPSKCGDRYATTSPWLDKNGDGCSAYESNDWCLLTGIATQAWKDAHEEGQTFDDMKDDYHNEGPASVCCACSGGSHEPPPETQPVGPVGLLTVV